MARTIRFHLDEHVPHAIAEGLRRRGIDVTTTADAGLRSATDSAHIAYAMAENRVVFSEDRDLLRLAARGAAHVGLAYCQRGSRSVGQIVRSLELLWEIYEPHEMDNRIEFI